MTSIGRSICAHLQVCSSVNGKMLKRTNPSMLPRCGSFTVGPQRVNSQDQIFGEPIDIGIGTSSLWEAAALNNSLRRPTIPILQIGPRRSEEHTSELQSQSNLV